jgi:hypothetical protein
VDVPDSDSSPPEVKIGSVGLDPEVFAKTGGFAGDTNAKVTTAVSPRTKSALVLATAEDSDSGIQSVTLLGALTRTCEKGGVGVQAVAELQIPQTSPPESSRPERLATQYAIDPGDVRRCAAGFRFTAAKLTLSAEARNGVGGRTVTPTISVTIP